MWPKHVPSKLITQLIPTLGAPGLSSYCAEVPIVPTSRERVGISVCQRFGRRPTWPARIVSMRVSISAVHSPNRVLASCLGVLADGVKRSSQRTPKSRKYSSRTLVQLGGLEPPTSCSTDRRSNQLSYNCILCRPQKGVPNRAETRCNAWLWQGREKGRENGNIGVVAACAGPSAVPPRCKPGGAKKSPGWPPGLFFGSENAAWIRRPA